MDVKSKHLELDITVARTCTRYGQSVTDLRPLHAGYDYPWPWHGPWSAAGCINHSAQLEQQPNTPVRVVIMLFTYNLLIEQYLNNITYLFSCLLLGCLLKILNLLSWHHQTFPPSGELHCFGVTSRFRNSTVYQMWVLSRNWWGPERDTKHRWRGF